MPSSFSFDFAPGSDHLVPGAWLETRPGRALGATSKRALLIGQVLSTGSVGGGVLTPLGSYAQAVEMFGRGSQLALMARAWFRNAKTVDVLALGVADNGSGVAAVKTVTVTVTTVLAGTIYAYIDGVLVTAAVTAGMTDVQVAAALQAAIAADGDLPYVATVADEVVTLTARNKGTAGNDLDVRFNFLGAAGGEETPGGVTLTVAVGTAGSTDPDLTSTIAAMGEEPFAYVVSGVANTTALGLLVDEFDETQTGRWGPIRKLYGHLFAGKRDTVANLRSYAAARNNPEESCLGYYDSPTSPWEWAAAHAAALAVAVNANVSRPETGLAVKGVWAPRLQSLGRFEATEVQSLLADGVSVSYVDAGGEVRMLGVVTTYKTNAGGAPDRSWKWAAKRFQAQEWNVRVLQGVAGDYLRAVLIPDSEGAPRGSSADDDVTVCSPSRMRGTLARVAAAAERARLIVNAASAVKAAVVEINTDNPDRIDALIKPQFSGQHRQTGVVSEFL